MQMFSFGGGGKAARTPLPQPSRTMSSALDYDGSSALRFPSCSLTTFGQFVAFQIPEIFRNPELKSTWFQRILESP